MANIVNLMNHLVTKEAQISTNKDDISTLKSDLNKTDFTVKELKTLVGAPVVEDLNGDFSITAGGTYILTLKGNSTITVNLPENQNAKVILKQTGAFSCSLPDCFKEAVQIGTTEGTIDVLEFTNYGKLRGYHVDQY